MNLHPATISAGIEGTRPEDRRLLLTNGYEPIPICGKAPLWRWRSDPITEALLSEIESSPNYLDHQSTGLRTGQLSVVDIDVRDKQHVEKIVDAITQILGRTDVQRIGSKGVALCYYNPDPIKKITVIGRPPHSDDMALLVEFLGSGQQVAAYGIHPDTGKPYEWPYSFDDGEPLCRRLAELPNVTADTLRAAAERAAIVLTSMGYLDVAVSGCHTRERAPSARRGDPVSLSWLLSALTSIPPTIGREDWLRVFWATKFANLVRDLDDSERIDLLDKWSCGDMWGDTHVPGYKGYADVAMNYDWAKGESDNPVGVGTLWEIAKGHGFQGGPPRLDLMEMLDSAVENGRPDFIAPFFETAPNSRWPQLTRRGKQILEIQPAGMVVHGWLRDKGFTALLAQRGCGKTLVSVGLALSIATDRKWMGEPTSQDFYVIYLCGEDQENTCAHIEAWCKRFNRGEIPARFIFIEDVPDLMNTLDCQSLIKHVRSEIPSNARAVIIADTWQRATSRATEGQNSDRDMAAAVQNLEEIGKAFRGPAIGCFHPPKADKATSTIHGSGVVENTSTGIWTLSDTDAGLKLEVVRIKGQGLGNFKYLSLEEVPLGRQDAFGRELTGAVVAYVGGTMLSQLDRNEKESAERAAVLTAALELIDKGIGLVRGNGSGQKPKDLAKVLRERGLRIEASAVLVHLNALQREGTLVYVDANKNSRAKAGFQRPRPN